MRAAAVLASAFLYLILVRTLRFRRARQPVGLRDGANLASMTLAQAWAIHNSLIEYEFPSIFAVATMFALFRAYGIATISSVLYATAHFSSPAKADKRIADTGLLLLEAALNFPGSDRSVAAVARINYLHASYRRAGKISNADLLYTLSLFALEPMRWVQRYEWRSLNATEMCAVGVLWKRFGDGFNITYGSLLSSSAGWTDGAHWLNELNDWSTSYEELNMRPAGTNAYIANATLAQIVAPLPRRLQAMGKTFATALLDKRLRAAMLISEPPASYVSILRAFVAVRKLVLLYLCLPRWRPKSRRSITVSTSTIPNGPSATSRLRPRKYSVRPWYIPPTIWSRFGPSAWLTRLQGGILPGDDGDTYFPNGFVAGELGPAELRRIGEVEMEHDKVRLKALFQGDGPVFAFQDGK